jgi:hypothetical protein
MTLTVIEITAALKAAEAAHAVYEKDLGHRDDNWAEWYAAFLLDYLRLQVTP